MKNGETQWTGKIALHFFVSLNGGTPPDRIGQVHSASRTPAQLPLSISTAVPQRYGHEPNQLQPFE